jgi:hypothetical protein
MDDAEYQARVELLLRELARIVCAHVDTLSPEHSSQVAITAAFVLLGGLAIERCGGSRARAVGMLSATPWPETLDMAHDLLTKLGSTPVRTL